MEIEKCLDIMAEEIGVGREELYDDAEFADLGVDGILAKAISGRLSREASCALSAREFSSFHDVRSFVKSVRDRESTQDNLKRPKTPMRVAPDHKKKDAVKTTGNKSVPKQAPLIWLLQGDPRTAKRTIFLLPDGSGSAMAYARLPRLAKNPCVYGLNSPYLGAGAFSTSMEDMAATFTTAIREAQPHGPYTLGGWSAGGLSATEVARILIQQGERVECIVLIDSPCRLEFDSLPDGVVEYLAERNLMGNWGSRKTPQWLLDHFDGQLAAIHRYTPAPLVDEVRCLCIIEAEDGVFASEKEYVDAPIPRNSTAKHLLAPRPVDFHPKGWEKLFPQSRICWARTSGQHFTMVHPPHNEQLSDLLGSLPSGIEGDTAEVSGRWTRLQGTK